MRRATAGLASVVGRLHLFRRSDGLIARTRWLFALAALVAMATSVPGALANNEGGWARHGVLVAVTVLTVVVVHRHQVGNVPMASDLVEAAAVACLAACSASPTVAFSYAFTAMWQRAVYGTWARGVVHSLLILTALATALFTWPLVHGRSFEIGTLLGPLPLTLLLSFVARFLAQNLFAREQAAAREKAMSNLSLGLLAASTRESIVALAWTTQDAICAASPGSHAIGVQRQDDLLTVYSSTGPVLPRLTPWTPEGLAPTGEPVELTGPLLQAAQQAVGHAGRWSSLSLPRPPGSQGRWLLVCEPPRGAPEVLASIRTVTNQVALALRDLKAHEELVRAALTDGLTGLANRVAFTRALEAALGESEDAPVSDDHIAVLFCDLDGFKLVNDGLGHAAGDELLRQVSARLTRTLRPDDLCARLGGDEFAVLMRVPNEHGTLGDFENPQTQVTLANVAGAVARRLVARIGEPVEIEGRSVRVGVSVGVALAEPGVSAKRLVQHADTAMYAAKAGGKNIHKVFDDSMRSKLDNMAENAFPTAPPRAVRGIGAAG